MTEWTEITSVKDAEQFGFDAKDFAEAFELLKREYELMTQALDINRAAKLRLEMVADDKEEDGFAANVSFNGHVFGYRSYYDEGRENRFFSNIKPYLFDYLGYKAIRNQ